MTLRSLLTVPPPVSRAPLATHRPWLCAGLLALLAGLAFWPALGNDFVPFDDVTYILKNPPVLQGLNLESVLWAFSTFHGGNWHPLTWLAHMLDISLYGLDPWGHHLSSVLGHLCNTLLLFFALRALTGATWRSAAVAALFAVHPLRVESVAWISERKDILNTLFWFAALWVYAGYARAPSLGRYLLLLLLFGLGLLAKSMIVTLPLLLLVLDGWPLGRLQNGQGTFTQRLARLLPEKVPLLLMSLALGLTTILSQSRGGAVSGLEHAGLGLRFYNALCAYAAYLGKMLWPVDLAILYPYPERILFWKAAIAALVLFLLTACCLRLRQRAPYLLTGWLWYLGTLAPVIGILQVGIQSMADRYTYVPLVGIFLALVWGLHALLAPRRWGQPVLVLLLVAAPAVLLPLTWRQIAVWQDGETLLSHAATVIPDHHEARFHLGGFLHTKGEYQRAAPHLEAYVRVYPFEVKPLDLLTDALLKEQRFAEALPFAAQLVRVKPDSGHYLGMYGFTLYALGNHPMAVQVLQQSLEKDPGQTGSAVFLGLAFARQGHFEAAAPPLREALDRERENPVYAPMVAGELARLAEELSLQGLAEPASRALELKAALGL